tara:strand:- start:1429 stop:2886 length:1458 start_codon:yes stop_codon:yes gene_type:complete
MADEPVTEEEPTRELTLEEANKPIIDTMGQQAVGAVDLGQGRFTPEQQAVQQEELLSSQSSLLDPTSREASVSTIQEDASGFLTNQISSPTAKENLGQIGNVERTFTSLPTDAQAAVGTLSTGAVIDPNQVVDERTKQQMLERGSLAEAQTQTLAQEATVEFQVGKLYESLEEGKPLPAWASANVKKVQDIMNARGLGSSSVAAAAMVQAIAESALPIAVQDANKYATIQLQNLNNQQQAALSNAATIAAMDKQNLDNRMRASQQNAQSFLQMDIRNSDREQQVNLLNYQTKVQSLFTDSAAENAKLQFNAKSQAQVDQFYDQLGTSVEKYNSDREAAMQQFNVDQTNSIQKFNKKMSDERDKFNSNMQIQIDQSNAVWRRQINTANTAEQNRANQINAASVLGITTASQNALWQQYRDEASFAFTASENSLQRNQQLALTALQNQFSEEMFQAQIDADAEKGLSIFIGRLLEDAFSGVMKGLFE